MSSDRTPTDRQQATSPARDIDFLIFKRRRLRGSKACYPCRRRKVKCNLGNPCSNCDIRGHPRLCSYAAQVQSAARPSGSVDTQGSQSHDQSPQAEPSTIHKNEGIFLDPLLPYTSKLHVGSGSLPHLLSTYQQLNRCQSQPSPNNTNSSPQTIFEILCLQDSSTNFPFINLWNPEDRLERVYDALPDDEFILRILHFCKGSIFRILPSVVHFPRFEATLSSFLDERVQLMSNSSSQLPPGCSPNWFALLFGILACGVQLSCEEEADAIKSRVFACCSFQCLRLSNFISFPTIEVVQSLIMLVNFLMNQADAGASWSMLGLTIRLAQSLGLHCSPNPDLVENPVVKDDATIKFYIWRALIWQDTLVSLCYDRTPGITVLEDIPSIENHGPEDGGFPPFSDSCHQLFVAANKISHTLNHAKFSGKHLPLEVILDFKDLLNRIESQSVPHVQDVSKCQNRDDYIQHYFFKVFSDSVMLCLCRPAVLSMGDHYGTNLSDIYLSRSYSILDTYLELLRLECPIRRSWIFVHVTLSCALSLGMAARDSAIAGNRAILRRFVSTLSKTTICGNISAYEKALNHLQRLVEEPV